MIKKADALERLTSLIGKEITNKTLHEALFCEEKHKKILVRFHLGKHTYVQFKIKQESNCADISILGNPNTFRVSIEENNGQHIVNSEPRINYSYL